MTAVLAGVIARLVIGAGGAVGIGRLAASPAAHAVATIPLRPLPQFPQWRGAHGTADTQVSCLCPFGDPRAVSGIGS